MLDVKNAAAEKTRKRSTGYGREVRYRARRCIHLKGGSTSSARDHALTYHVGWLDQLAGSTVGQIQCGRRLAHSTRLSEMWLARPCACGDEMHGSQQIGRARQMPGLGSLTDHNKWLPKSSGGGEGGHAGDDQWQAALCLL